ncbi:hypothetical protein [Jiella marina]|uniref:hypothetical protein n=1 Tax=Jiella sp. LLJ827 TaxID=2917712 RepID=UPI002101811A|nr:hypothetical protein [Jiella sp. LLJ827]MCQ0987595.1 hypothetical protein [Jiella sp. LLJ827]
MSQSTVSSIIENEKDSRGVEIICVYNRNPPKYAVYRAADQVMVQFADDTELDKDGEKINSQQRQALLPLMPIRGEINGLIDGWRNNSTENLDDNSKSKRRKTIRKSKAQALAKLFDRRTADALVLALEGDIERATALLEGLKEDVSDERRSVAKVQYLSWALLSAFVLIYLSLIIPLLFLLAAHLNNSDTAMAVFSEMQLSTAVTFGVLGALFSIALDIRNKSITTDFKKRDNIADAVLRTTVGALSAIILFSLLKSGIFGLRINNNEIALAPGSNKLSHTAIIIAFLAGFSERLVGGVLSKIENSVSNSKDARENRGTNSQQTTTSGISGS